MHGTGGGLQSPTHTLLGRGYSPEHGCLPSSLPSSAWGLRLVKPEVKDTISQLLSAEAAAAEGEEEGWQVPGLVSGRMSHLPAWPLSSRHTHPISKPYSCSSSVTGKALGKTTQTQKPLADLDPVAPQPHPRPISLHTDSALWPPGAASLSPAGLPPSHLRA